MNFVFRCYVEKKTGFDVEAKGKLRELRELLGLNGLAHLRIVNRYDIEGIDYPVYLAAKTTVFSEPQSDVLFDEALPPVAGAHRLLAVEPLPGQYDQRSDSCAQCIQLLAGVERPVVCAARVYILVGQLTDQDMERVRSYLINPVESREASMDKPATLAQSYPEPAPVAVLEGFTSLDADALSAMLGEYGLAMDTADLLFFQTYFREEERREPTITELRLVDTYWSDHCRHTTFGTHIDGVAILDKDVKDAYDAYLNAREEVYGPEQAAVRPQTLMDIATMGMKTLKKRGLLSKLDESEEINACSVKITATVDGEPADWLLMFKNETHNHPTEIEPFGGAATCLGGAIRDPLSGRAYVYQAMRVTGCGDPRTPLTETPEGKLPQRKIAQTAAAGYSSYGNQIGLATGHVAEIYHPGYVAKHMEVGAVVGAAPAEHVVRLRPEPGDQVILLGGRTGRDGVGGATGSSKTHTLESLDTCAAEVQKGNPPEERKIQRLFRNPQVTGMIKRCNDFGAGGVSVAIGELADGLSIDLNAVRKKYDGLDGTELAISESQERMAVVVAPQDADAFIAAAEQENLEAYIVAEVTQEPRLTMRWNGAVIADLSRAFLSSNGAAKHTTVSVPKLRQPVGRIQGKNTIEKLEAIVHDPTLASQRGLVERFDSTIGAGSVLAPFGGKNQNTPAQVMAALLPVGPGHETDTCSVMSYGFDPYFSEQNPFAGAATAVVDSIAKLVSAGCSPASAYLSFQEYFEKLKNEPDRWGKPFAALLGAFTAQMSLGVAAIGGKDSMSGSFLDMDVPPTLISFAVATAKAQNVISPEFKGIGHSVYLFYAPEKDYHATRTVWDTVHRLCQQGKVLAAWAVGAGGVAEGLMKMSFGNDIGFSADPALTGELLFSPHYGSIIVECEDAIDLGLYIGRTEFTPMLEVVGHFISLHDLRDIWESTLEAIYPTEADTGESDNDMVDIFCNDRSAAAPAVSCARPRAVIPVFPGTNCEYDTAAACLRAGIEPEILVIRNLTRSLLEESASALESAIGRSQMVILPGGFSGGDEPDGSAKFICSFLRNPKLTDAVHELLKQRDGLMLGICNGFQALIKLGLVPYGEIRPMDDSCATLTFNLIGRHQSRYVTTRVASLKSPWMLKCELDESHTVPVSHGEGRFVAPPGLLSSLIENGQIATQYTDIVGIPSLHISANPNGAMESIEGIFSPDGRVFGKMAHSERWGTYVAKNIPGNKHQPIFESGAAYFK
ncbi:MAG: Phosphoribosylformylglycinamidine synthase, synthetase subunit [Oscillospiraceae bacterium]|nr:Phosphoribosylformylglycinamidine synthase, synthetase subunit [Oscillospiraceae bacterium]